MSLINQVLKDLEQRHAGEVRGVARAVRPLPEQAHRRRWIVLGLAAAVCVVGSAWWYLSPPPALARNPQRGDLTSTPVAPSAGSTAVTPVAASVPAVATPAPDALTPGPAAPAVARAPDRETNAHAPLLAQTARLTPQITGLPQPMPAGAPDFPGAATRAPASPPAPRVRAVKAVARGAETALALEAENRKPVARVLPKADPEVSASGAPIEVAGPGAALSEDARPSTRAATANIDKQVRPPTERERVEAEFHAGMAALSAGDSTDAENKLRAALAIDPLADKARQALLGLYIERGRREDAEQLLEERLRVDRRPAGFALALARLELERGANSEALATLQRSLANGEGSADYQAMLANALGRLGEHGQAAQHFEMAARLAPRNPVWLMGLGLELRADNRFSEARAAFQRARELGGLNPQLASFVDQQLSELKLK